MGEIFVEGLGVFEIEGEEPTTDELNGIADMMGDPEDEGDPAITAPPPGSTLPGMTIPPGVGLERSRTGKEPALEGPLGLMPVEARARTRGVIEDQPGLVQFVTEMTPATIGTAGGAALGSVLGPAGTVGGGMLGGIFGELFAQETGLAPSSELNLALAGAGPAAGPVLGKSGQLVRRGIGQGIVRAPFARAARSRNVMGRALNQVENMATQILAKQKGLMAMGTSELYDAAARGGVRVPVKTMDNTIKAIQELSMELKPLAGLDEVAQARKVLKSATKVLLDNPEGVPIDKLVQARAIVGAAVKKARMATKDAGLSEFTTKRVFAAISDDLDKIAATPFKKGRQARLAKAAIARAKLGFATDKLEQNFINHIVDNGEDVIVNFKGIQNWLNRVTNPKSKVYDKNFTRALKDEIPQMKETFKRLAEITKAGSPGGPGSLVLRGQSAKAGRALVGGSLGFLGLGAPGAAAGAVIGASAPEMLVSILTSPKGAAFLERAAKLGQGSINTRNWALAGELALRGLGQKRENVPFSITPEEARERMISADEAEAAEEMGGGEETVPAETGGQGRRTRKRLPPGRLQELEQELLMETQPSG